MTKRKLEIGLGGVDKAKDSMISPRQLEPLLKGLLKKGDYPSKFWVDVDGPEVRRYIEVIQELTQKRKIASAGCQYCKEEYVEEEQSSADWYLMEPEAEVEDMGSSELGIPLMKAARMKPGVHSAAIVGSAPFYSEEFKAFVEQKKLKGLDFVWLPDVGKYKARQWFLGLPQQMIGRGLDHPWFDPKKIKDSTWQCSDPVWRTGVVHFEAAQIKGGIQIEGPMRELLQLCKQDWPTEIWGHPTYLKSCLPTGDFAYAWTCPDRQRRNYLLTSRELCVRREVKQMLIEAKLVPAKCFKALCIVEEPPQGVVVLDHSGDSGPGPMFTGEKLAAVRQAEREGLAELAKKAKPERPASLTNALKLLKAAQRKDKKRFPLGANAKALEEIAKRLGLVESWKKVLEVSNGFRIEAPAATDGVEVRFEALERLVAGQKGQKEIILAQSEPLAKKLVYVGDTYFGDMFFLRTVEEKKGDCPVVLVSHETGQDMTNWPTVAGMIEELLGG